MTAPANLALGAPATGRAAVGASLAELWPIPVAFAAFVAAWKLVVIVGGLPVYILPPPETVAVRFVTALRERVAGALESGGPRGGVTVLTAPPTVFAASPDGAVPGLALMRAVKDQFDPDHRMFPDRFGGGG